MGTMIICICQNISERDIARAVAGGCCSFAALQDELEVGKACGTCICSAKESFAEQKMACQGHRGKPAFLQATPALR
jgi:bacterioferritin-associated ferredoxin